MEALRRLNDATVILDPGDMEPFRRDESHVVGALPRAVVRPRGPGALRELVRIAKGEGLTLVPRGTGTGKAGGCTPTPDAIVVDLTQWPGSIELSRGDLALHAPASAMLRDLKGTALQAGLFYAPDPNSWDQCSFGGTLATNAGGICACKYGMTRHWVLALEALMEDGELHRFSIPTVKSNSGPSLAQLLVGSEGIFGLITSATVRLIPAPRMHLTLLLPVKDWQQLLDLPTALNEAGFLPNAFEFWDPAVLEDLRRHGPEAARRMPGEALALLEFDDPDCMSEDFLERLLGVLGPVAEDLQTATDERQREALWSVRRLTSSHLKERYPKKVSEDIVVPRSRIRDFFKATGSLGLPMVSYGHLGDGNLHVNLLAAGETAPDELERQVMSLFRTCLELGGGLTGEHGIGLAKRKAFLSLSDPYQVQALCGIKQALDPLGIFNRGKVI
nr:FAD-binding oxidoreductase [uncultured Holophaga sp.]